mgnify:CR=1 FL=1
MNDFLARLQNGGLLFDGSMGALIEARGVTTNCPALLNAENPRHPPGLPRRRGGRFHRQHVWRESHQAARAGAGKPAR